MNYDRRELLYDIEVITVEADTYSELKLQFSSKDLAIEYAKKNKIEFEVIEPKNKKIVKKSYADNFTKR